MCPQSFEARRKLDLLHGRRLGIGGSDSSVLKTVKLEVGVSQVLGDLSLERVLEVLLEKTRHERFGAVKRCRRTRATSVVYQNRGIALRC